MTSRIFRVLAVSSVAVTAMVFPGFHVSGQMPARAPRYAITNARIITAAGAPIEKGTVVMRDGVIEDVGASVNVPADALVVDGSGLVVYPGLIMANASTVACMQSSLFPPWFEMVTASAPACAARFTSSA